MALYDHWGLRRAARHDDCPAGPRRHRSDSDRGTATPHHGQSHAIYQLAVVNAKGEPAVISQLFAHWAIVWLPLFLPMVFLARLWTTSEGVPFISAVVWLLLWLSAAVYAVIHPHRGLHDRLAGTWVARR